ncbi:MAG: IgGFc-binding protein [Myxococcales bacterium]|nr:IgGFc-binding protein [Myxococcales bacterium]
MKRAALAAVLLALASGCREKVQTRPPPDAGLLCGPSERVVDGECEFFCDRDGDCAAGQRCNLLTGACEPRPQVPDAGVPPVPCTNGAERCSADNKAIEHCGPDGKWQLKQSCPPPSGFCLNEKCLACRPGSTICDTVNSKLVTVCLDDGSGTRTVTCSGGGACNQGECRECAPDTTRCAADADGGQVAQACQRTSDETLAWKWANNGDSFDGTCITKKCEAPSGTSPARCTPPSCFPGSTQCKDTKTQQVCSSVGAWTDVTCSSLPGYTAGAECQSGVCVDECVDAAKAKSYFGCSYWTAVQDNSVDRYFKGGTQSGQGTADSDFAFVVANRSTLAATVEVWRHQGGVPVRLKTVTVPGRNDAATKGLQVIYVPWQSIGPASNPTGVASTGLARFGYRITSTKPITLYQFNPLTATKTVNKNCTQDFFYAPLSSDCNAYGDYSAFDPGTWGVCENNNRCRYNTYSNDASLLLPEHILGISHVVMSNEHVVFSDGLNQPPDFDVTGHVTVVATQDNTTVTFKSSAKTVGGGTVAAMNKGDTRVFTMNSYDVLQVATTNLGISYIECGGNPFCGGIGPCKPSNICRVDNDLTGTVISSSKPIAVFGGAACITKPYNRVACDHVEEQIFPFSTWGKRFVAQASYPLRLANQQFATNSPPDHWKIVASCPASTCPNGTLITFAPAAPAAADVLLPNRCLSGTIATNNCRLAGGAYMEFKSRSSFVITADNPIAVAQFFPGQGPTGLPTQPEQGDPSMVLLPPAEQWRSSYTLLAAPGIKDNYLAIAIDDTVVASVEVDGSAIAGFVAISGTTFKVKNQPISTGTHTVTVVAKPGVTTMPGAGVTVYGYDAYVSYGYTGGLDLGTIVTGIDPGG